MNNDFLLNIINLHYIRIISSGRNILSFVSANFHEISTVEIGIIDGFYPYTLSKYPTTLLTGEWKLNEKELQRKPQKGRHVHAAIAAVCIHNFIFFP